MRERLVALAETCVDEDGADVIVLAGAPLAGLARSLQGRAAGAGRRRRVERRAPCRDRWSRCSRGRARAAASRRRRPSRTAACRRRSRRCCAAAICTSIVPCTTTRIRNTMHRRHFLQATGAAAVASLGAPSLSRLRPCRAARSASSSASRPAAAPTRWRASSSAQKLYSPRTEETAGHRREQGRRRRARWRPIRRAAAGRRRDAADGAHQQPCARAEPAAEAALPPRARFRADRAARRHAEPADRQVRRTRRRR